MFPDGGYAVNHGYGEVAHWEPFQGLFRDWILETGDPSGEEAAPYVAFYLGLASHGMADQVFDSMYMERSRVYDAEFGWTQSQNSLDTSQDIVFANLTGAQGVPERWLPEVLPELFEAVGVEVDMETLENGQTWLELAVASVGAFADDSVSVDQHLEAFPWGCTHLLDAAVPGAPPMEAEVVARYWQALWAELLGETVSLEVIGTFPAEGAVGHEDSAEDVEARLSLVFNRGLYSEDVVGDYFRVAADGAELTVDLDLFYRDHSHVVNVSPIDGWVERSGHALTVSTELSATDGRHLDAPFSLTFSTTPEPEGCGCTSSRDSGGWLSVWLGALVLGRRRGPRSRPSPARTAHRASAPGPAGRHRRRCRPSRCSPWRRR
jgi:hypothetical protein